jgi:hypothetical protein
MTLVNLTPHAVNLILANGEAMTLAPSGVLARCATTTVAAGEVGGVPLSRTTFGDVVGLPEPTEGTMFVVSALVRSAVPHRTDVASPGDLVRDAGGNVVGCKGLVVN